MAGRYVRVRQRRHALADLIDVRLPIQSDSRVSNFFVQPDRITLPEK